jgi:isoleucyl-tRNA synthetase
MDYSKTLNLPQTSLPMKASLPIKEPQILEFWEKNQIYHLVQKKTANKSARILHDGPPYSNGKIHLGQAFNKILKDIVVKFWNMTGFHSPYVPGWDTHGLPNELEAIKTFKLDRRSIHPVELRKKCRESSLHYVEIQKKQFQRLGIQGEWEKPYLTLDHSYEAAIIEAFGMMSEKGYIYRGKKPVYWCTACETSLAEAEIEYQEKESPSIFVKFPIKSSDLLKDLKISQNSKIYVLIWTTTPWTLPGNVAVALHPEETYCLAASSDGEVYLLAEKRLESVSKAAGVTLTKICDGFSGSAAASNTVCRHPFLDRDSVLITQSYVTMEDGTGCVHTAPGHGAEDFEASKEFHLPVLVPVDAHGVLTEEAGLFKGLFIQDANEKIVEHLRETRLLLHSSKISHSYPHCWRCRKPVIFRATEQWFVGVDHRDLRKKSIAACKEIKWYPGWGETRMRASLEQRPDWCISRQRVWGVPLPVFYCLSCDKPIVTKETVESVKRHFLEEGADSWFSKTAAELLPVGYLCPFCQSQKGFRKENDIFDVWFESGVSHLAVLENHPSLSWPSHLYLEGPDQYRGWFQVSLLSSMAVKEIPPYQQVLTHGWTLDLEGRAMHKSIGNVIDPMDILKEYGADILRLFFASVEFKNDVRIGEKVLKDVAESYRKIRNTCRFLLANLYDFHPEHNSVSYIHLKEIDQWALSRLYDLIEETKKFYENYDFHLVYYRVLNFCVQDLSSVYLDLLKDRLYTFRPDSEERRSAQTVLYRILMTLICILSPILSFTTEEIWQNLPVAFKDHISVLLLEWPALPVEHKGDEIFRARWGKILGLREAVYQLVEVLRQNKIVRQPLETCVYLIYDPSVFQAIFQDFSVEKVKSLLTELLIVSDVRIVTVENGEIKDVAAKGRVIPGPTAQADKLKSILIKEARSRGEEKPEDSVASLAYDCFPQNSSGKLEEITSSDPTQALQMIAAKASGEKCARCWRMVEKVSTEPSSSGLCHRCVKVIEGIPVS